MMSMFLRGGGGVAAFALSCLCACVATEEHVSACGADGAPDCADVSFLQHVIVPILRANSEAAASIFEVVEQDASKQVEGYASDLEAGTYISEALASAWAPRSIQEVFKGTSTDKLWRHGYHRYYETELLPFREKADLRILEIGADSGISLGAWMIYFKNPSAVQGVAYNVDADEAKAKACEMLKDKCPILAIFSLDQSNKTALAGIKDKNPQGWDIIIDDGSHKPDHNIISFESLWEKIRPGGLYVVEDIETSYVDKGSIYGYELHGGIGKEPPDNAVEKFKQLADVVSRKHFQHPEYTVFHGIDKDVASVKFADGIIFVQKKPEDAEWDTYPRGRLAFNRDASEQSFREYTAQLKLEREAV